VSPRFPCDILLKQQEDKMPTVIYGERETTLTDADSEDGNLWLSLDDLEPATGWQLKPEGVCRGEQCVPIPPADSDDFLRGDHFNLTRFASHLGQPLVSDPGEDVWVFGEPVAPTGPLYAPDFTLPDLEGREHTLSDYRGNKVFLATWASW
jgi:hypothetical protein